MLRTHRPQAVGAVLVVVLVLAMLAGVCLGSVSVPLEAVGRVIYARVVGVQQGDSGLHDYIVWQLRIPRVILAALIGASLALAGTALQGLVRNPLADPYVIGVSSGASLGAVLVMVVAPVGALAVYVPLSAFVFAVATAALVFLLSLRGGQLADSRIVLAGVAVGYVAMAGTNYLQLQAQPGEITGILFWMMGSLAAARWESLIAPAICLALCLVWLLRQGTALNAAALGDDDAAAVGVNLRVFRTGLLVTASLLTAVSVSVGGGIGFVGLIIPHAVRLVVGADHRRLLPLSALAGSAFLVIIDLIARTVGSPNEYPLTIFTAAIGGPFFLWLLRTREDQT